MKTLKKKLKIYHKINQIHQADSKLLFQIKTLKAANSNNKI